MTRYIIAFLIKGPAKKRHLKLTNRLSKEFGIKNVSKRIAPHITLKDLGEIKDNSNLKFLEEFLKTFVKKEKRFKLELSGINDFKKEVIFIGIKKTKDLMDFYKRFYSEIKRINWINLIPKFEGKNMEFHSTLGIYDMKQTFREISDSLSREKVNYKLIFDQIVIMKGINHKWRIHKRFNLK